MLRKCHFLCSGASIKKDTSIKYTQIHFKNNFNLFSNKHRVLDVNKWDEQISDSNQILKYDAISCLNLLDRCDEPVTLIRKIKNALTPNGLLIVALVLPFKPCETILFHPYYYY